MILGLRFKCGLPALVAVQCRCVDPRVARTQSSFPYKERSRGDPTNSQLVWEFKHTPTLANVAMIGSIARIVEKLGVATTMASMDTWPATVRRIDHHLEEGNVEGQDQARLEDI